MARRPYDHVKWSSVTVAGRKVCYAAGGSGVPVVFIHGWALGNRSYKRALKRLIQLGCSVYAPALPGFGGSSDLPGRAPDLPDYAAWLAGFLDEVGLDRPALIV